MARESMGKPPKTMQARKEQEVEPWNGGRVGGPSIVTLVLHAPFWNCYIQPHFTSICTLAGHHFSASRSSTLNTSLLLGQSLDDVLI
jgi:hypothetical protein